MKVFLEVSEGEVAHHRSSKQFVRVPCLLANSSKARIACFFWQCAADALLGAISSLKI